MVGAIAVPIDVRAEAGQRSKQTEGPLSGELGPVILGTWEVARLRLMLGGGDPHHDPLASELGNDGRSLSLHARSAAMYLEERSVIFCP